MDFKKTENTNETNTCFFEKISKVVKALARLIRKKETGPKSIKSDMKEKLLLTPQKYKES